MRALALGLLLALGSLRDQARCMNINNLVNDQVADDRPETVPADPAAEMRAEKRKDERKAFVRQQRIELAAQSKLRIPKASFQFPLTFCQ